MKQTAVEWLVEEFKETILKEYGEGRFNELINKAKEMEREQLAKAELKGSDKAVESLWKMMNDRD